MPWEGLAPLELRLWEDVGTGTTLLFQSSVKFLGSEQRILDLKCASGKFVTSYDFVVCFGISL